MKKLIVIALAVVMVLTLGVAPVVYANNSIDRSGPPSHWAVITLNADGALYGVIWMRGWYTTTPSDPGPDGTINHVIWEVVGGSLPPRIVSGDEVFSIHGWYEDGTHKWIHNARDFNMHLETDFNTPCPVDYDGMCRAVSGKSYGTPVTGKIEWHWAWVGSPPFTP